MLSNAVISAVSQIATPRAHTHLRQRLLPAARCDFLAFCNTFGLTGHCCIVAVGCSTQVSLWFAAVRVMRHAATHCHTRFGTGQTLQCGSVPFVWLPHVAFWFYGFVYLPLPFFAMILFYSVLQWFCGLLPGLVYTGLGHVYRAAVRRPPWLVVADMDRFISIRTLPPPHTLHAVMAFHSDMTAWCHLRGYRVTVAASLLPQRFEQ